MTANHNLSKAAALVTILITFCVSGTATAFSSDPGKTPLGLFINGRTLKAPTDSLDINTSGALVLHAANNAAGERLIFIDDNLPSGAVSFKVVIRHRMQMANMPTTMYDERFEDGKEFTRIEIQSILKKAKVGDQLLIIPVDKNNTYENSKSPLIIEVINGGC
jgi:hypothetical protein